MKLKNLLILSFIICFTCNPVFASNEHSFILSCLELCNCNKCKKSETVVLVDINVSNRKSKFPNCKEHILLETITTYYYSDGSSKTHNSYSILDNNEFVLNSDLSSVEHTIHNNKHYFIVEKNNSYGIYDTNGKLISTHKYKYLKEELPNRLLAKYNRMYGIINIKEEIIVPIQYKKMKKLNGDLFLTKLDGYWGFITSNNKIVLKNEYNKIKQTNNNTYILKKDKKYGLADYKGNIIHQTLYDKIKPLNQYLIIKKDEKYGILDTNGKPISKIEYKKVRLKRNVLEIKIDKEWCSFTITNK